MEPDTLELDAHRYTAKTQEFVVTQLVRALLKLGHLEQELEVLRDRVELLELLEARRA